MNADEHMFSHKSQNPLDYCSIALAPALLPDDVLVGSSDQPVVRRGGRGPPVAETVRSVSSEFAMDVMEVPLPGLSLLLLAADDEPKTGASVVVGLVAAAAAARRPFFADCMVAIEDGDMSKWVIYIYEK